MDTLYAQNLHPVGRYKFHEDKKLELISSAVHFGFSFEGDECIIFASLADRSQHNYLQYELDGKYQKRLRIEGDSSTITIKALQKGTHTVWIYKATEAHSGPIYIKKISGQKINALPILPRPLIEFIGNSITCGAAADPSEVACGTGDYHDQHNAYYSYGPRAARALGADFILSSVSGIGIYRNWNSDGPAMPQVYEKLDFTENSPEKWEFGKFTPRIVCIALGTNDFSRGDGQRPRPPFDSSVYVSSFILFIQSVQAKYPNAKLVLLNSPVVTGINGVQLQNCLRAVKMAINKLHSGKPAELFFFNSFAGRGCTGHPSIEDHEIMGNEIVPFLKELLDHTN